MATTVTQREATERFPELLEQVVARDEEVIIAQDGMPVARIVGIPHPKRGRRLPGGGAGEIIIAPGFDDPLPDSVVDEFYQ